MNRIWLLVVALGIPFWATIEWLVDPKDKASWAAHLSDCWSAWKETWLEEMS